MEVMISGSWEGEGRACDDACCLFVTMKAYRQTLPNPPALDGHYRPEQLATSSSCYLARAPRSQKLWRCHSHNTTGLYSTV
jgi:hypothetical protein